MPIDYKKSCIYEIVCRNDLEQRYIGSTTNFKRRMWGHKTNCLRENSPKKDFKLYSFIRANGGWDNFNFNIIEEFSCNSVVELTERERFWFEDLKPTLNSRFPRRTQKERDETFKQERNDYKKEWAVKNREKVLKTKREYYQRKKAEKIKSLTTTNATEETGLHN
jgi:group I intron endonuclease